MRVGKEEEEEVEEERRRAKSAHAANIDDHFSRSIDSWWSR